MVAGVYKKKSIKSKRSYHINLHLKKYESFSVKIMEQEICRKEKHQNKKAVSRRRRKILSRLYISFYLDAFLPMADHLLWRGLLHPIVGHFTLFSRVRHDDWSGCVTNILNSYTNTTNIPSFRVNPIYNSLEPTWYW